MSGTAIVSLLLLVQYFFRVLDLDNKNAVGKHELKYFYQSLRDKLVVDWDDMPSFKDVYTEMMDFMGCRGDHITLKEVLRSPNGGKFVLLLLDASTFFVHENRYPCLRVRSGESSRTLCRETILGQEPEEPVP
jgi:hypothetical protein